MANYQIAVYSFSRRDFRKCSLFVFAARLSKLQFACFRGTTLILQFACFRGATFESAVYSFSCRDFRYCSLLVFAARLSKMQFTRFRGATFDIAVYLFSPPPHFPIHQKHQKMFPLLLSNYSLLVFAARLLKLQFTRFRPPNLSQSTKIIQKCFPRTPKMFQKWCPKPPQIEQKSTKLQNKYNFEKNSEGSRMSTSFCTKCAPQG